MNGSMWRVGAICGPLAFMLGCDGSPENPPSVSATEVKQEAREAVETATAYAAAQRRKLADRAQQTVADAKRELAEARRELAGLPDETRERLQNAIARAERAQKALGKEVDALQQTSAKRWETAEKRVSDALAEMAEAQREIAAAMAGKEQSG